MINASTAAVEAAALQRAWQDLTNSALEPEQEPVSSRSQRSATGSYLDLLYPNMQPSGPDLYCFPVGTTWRTAASTCLQLAAILEEAEEGEWGRKTRFDAQRWMTRPRTSGTP